eukprot:scaffold38753_cov57-Phaeocystis_antarctica.AAC.4
MAATNREPVGLSAPRALPTAAISSRAVASATSRSAASEEIVITPEIVPSAAPPERVAPPSEAGGNGSRDIMASAGAGAAAAPPESSRLATSLRSPPSPSAARIDRSGRSGNLQGRRAGGWCGQEASGTDWR